MKREFTGVFIPAHIWLSKELIPAEKMILGEIDGLSKSRGYCDASRSHFAEWLNCTRQNITYYFEKLERLGFITVEKKPGYRNQIRLVIDRFYTDNQGVNGTDGGGKHHLRGGVNGTYGGGKRDLPEIQDKYNNKDKEYCPAKTPDVEFDITIIESRKEKIPLKADKSSKENTAAPLKVPVVKYDLKKHPLPDLEKYRNELLQEHSRATIERRKEIEAVGLKVGALIQTEKDIDAVISRLNESAGFNYRLTTPTTRAAIKKRLTEYEISDLLLVIDHKCKAWAHDEKMHQYLRPETLFNGHFESYLQAAKAKPIPPKPQPGQLPSNNEMAGVKIRKGHE